MFPYPILIGYYERDVVRRELHHSYSVNKLSLKPIIQIALEQAMLGLSNGLRPKDLKGFYLLILNIRLFKINKN